MTLRDRGFLLDILYSARLVGAYIEGLTREAFRNDTKTQDAVIRRIEVIGEAAKRLTGAALIELPAIDWRAIRGMRDRVIHRYWDVELDKVWDTATDDMQPLIASLEAFLLA